MISEKQIIEILGQVTESYCFLPLEEAGAALPGSLEAYEVLWPSHAGSCLFIAVGEGLGAAMAESLGEDATKPGVKEDALREWVNILAGVLASKVFGPQGLAGGRFLPRPVPAQRPEGPARVLVRAAVAGRPIELGFWGAGR